MSEFQLDNLRILDNGDGIFHDRAPSPTRPLRSGVRRVADQIQDSEGHPLLPDAAQVRTLMTSLGVTTLQGLRLSPASQYLSCLAEAEGFSRSGRTPEARRSLEACREWARQARLTFNEARGEQILMRSAVAELGQLERDAAQAAEAGNLVGFEDARNAARDVVARTGTPLENWESSGLPFPPSRARLLELRSLRQARPALLQQAEGFSQEGAVTRLQETLARLREYYVRAGDPISETLQGQWRDLERGAQLRASAVALRSAGEQAALGQVVGFRRLASEARDAARLGGVPLNSEQEATLQSLERQAFAASANRLMDELGNRIRAAAARENEIDMDQARATLQEARVHAELSGTAWSPAQETRAVQLRREAFLANIAWRFRQAREAAALGKVDDTLVPLRAGRDMANQAGLPFDETQASDLLRQATSNGIELSFHNAECFALAHDETNARIHLETARDYCLRLQQIFPEARAREILTLIQRPQRFRTARFEQQSCSSLLPVGQSYHPEEEAEEP